MSSLDPDRTWFRYHPLFAELLRSQLRFELPDLVPALHRRAALWHGGGARAAQALRHAAAAADWDLVGALAGEHWVPLLIRGELGTLGGGARGTAARAGDTRPGGGAGVRRRAAGCGRRGGLSAVRPRHASARPGAGAAARALRPRRGDRRADGRPAARRPRGRAHRRARSPRSRAGRGADIGRRARAEGAGAHESRRGRALDRRRRGEPRATSRQAGGRPSWPAATGSRCSARCILPRKR